MTNLIVEISKMCIRDRNQQVIQEGFMGHQVFTVNLYELPSIVFVFPGKAQELFLSLIHIFKTWV